MKMKIFTFTIVVGCMLGSIALGQTLTITGTLCSLTKTEITVKEGTHYWTVQRTTSTSITPPSAAAGAAVTVQCKSPDAQRKEGPCPGTTSPTPKRSG
jgi:hypothetical protein